MTTEYLLHEKVAILDYEGTIWGDRPTCGTVIEIAHHNDGILVYKILPLNGSRSTQAIPQWLNGQQLRLLHVPKFSTEQEAQSWLDKNAR